MGMKGNLDFFNSKLDSTDNLSKTLYKTEKIRYKISFARTTFVKIKLEDVLLLNRLTEWKQDGFFCKVQTWTFVGKLKHPYGLQSWMQHRETKKTSTISINTGTNKQKLLLRDLGPFLWQTIYIFVIFHSPTQLYVTLLSKPSEPCPAEAEA